MKLYGSKGCGSAVVEVMLQLAGIEYQFIDAITWAPFKQHDDLANVNPLAQVPTLVLDDGSVMTESAAIVLWLCERVPRLVPESLAERAQFYRWMLFVPANIYPMISLRDFPARWVEGEDAQRVFRETTGERLKVLWSQMESALQPAPYALGGGMSALDIYLAMVSRWSPGRKWLAENCPNLTAAVALTEQHPVVAKVWEKNFGK